MTGGLYLFLGGENDGQRLVTATDPVSIPVSNGEGGYERQTYRTLRLAGETDEFVIYVESSLSPDDMVRMLVENYRPSVTAGRDRQMDRQRGQ